MTISNQTYKEEKTCSTSLDNEKGELQEIPLEPCCGQRPTVQVWPRNKMALITCQNPLCPNHYGVLAFDGEREKKWDEFRRLKFGDIEIKRGYSVSPLLDAIEKELKDTPR